MQLGLTQRTLHGKIAHLSGEHTHTHPSAGFSPSSSPSPLPPGLYNMAGQRGRARPRRRQLSALRSPGGALLRPGHRRGGGPAGSGGPTGEKEKVSPHYHHRRHLAPRPSGKLPPPPRSPSAPRPAQRPPSPLPVLTAQRATGPAAGGRTPLPRRPRLAIPPAPRYILGESPSPLTHTAR